MNVEKNKANLSSDRGIFSSAFLNLTPLICSLMVIIIHQHNTILPISSIQSRIISFFTHGICTAAVPIFMLISGYLFFRDVNCYKQIFKKQRKRILTVLMPFIVWSALYYGFFAVADQFVPGVLQGSVDTSFLGIVKGVVFYEYAFPLWYMFQLCVYIALAPIIFFVLKNKAIGAVVLVCTSVLGVIGTFDIDINWNGLERGIFQVNFFGYFLFGCILAQWKEWERGLLQFAKSTPWIALVVLLIGFGLLASLVFDDLLLTFNNRVLVPVVFACFLLLMIKLSSYFPQIAKPKTSTMVLYGVHPVVGVILNEVIFARLQLGALLQFILSVVAVTAVSFGVAWVIRHIKPVHCILSGNR